MGVENLKHIDQVVHYESLLEAENAHNTFQKADMIKFMEAKKVWEKDCKPKLYRRVVARALGVLQTWMEMWTSHVAFDTKKRPLLSRNWSCAIRYSRL